MIALIKDNLPAIEALCRINKVKTLYLFVSAARDTGFSDESDIDFLYRMDAVAIPEYDYADYYFNVLFGIEQLLQRKVDLVSMDKVQNPYFVQAIKKDQTLLYAA